MRNFHDGINLTFSHEGNQYLLDVNSQQIYLIEDGEAEPVYEFDVTGCGTMWVLTPLYDGDEIRVERDEKDTLISLLEASKAAVESASHHYEM